MSDGPSREEFTAFTLRVYKQMDDGFTGVHDRLDVLNGRTRANSENIVNLDARMKTTERIIARRRLDDEEDAEVAETRHRRNVRAEDGEPAAEVSLSDYKKREKALIGLGMAVLVVMVKLLELAWTTVWNFAMTHKP